jgi:glycosyltransferase involved in cell wall biosynthesis
MPPEALPTPIGSPSVEGDGSGLNEGCVSGLRADGRRLHGLVFTADDAPDYSPNRSLFAARDPLRSHGVTFDYAFASSLRSVARSYVRNAVHRRKLRWDYILMNGLALLRRTPQFVKAIRFFHALGCPVFMLWRETGAMIENLGRKFPADYPAFLNAFGPAVHHLAVSSYVAADVVRTIPEAASATPVHNCAYIPQEFRVRQMPAAKPLFVNLATVQPRKGPDLFVDAAVQACERNDEVEFEWYGDEAPPELRQRIREHGFMERIRFPGRIDSPWPVLQRASALFFTSRDEPQSKSVLEAMGMARTVVCFSTGGTPEALADTGYCVPPFDTSAAVDRLLEIAGLPPEQRINYAAQRRYESLFTPEAYAARVAAVIRGVIPAPGRRDVRALTG